MLTVRRYQEADHCDVWNLYVLGQQQISAYIEDDSWDSDLRDIEGVYLQNGGDFLVGLCDGRIVAMGGLLRTSNTHAEVKRMRVHPDFRRRGFGRTILAELEIRATRSGYMTLHLITSAERLAARQLYLSHGFKESGRTVFKGIDCILFEKRIGSRE